MQFDVGNFPSLGWTEPANKLIELAQVADDVGFDRFGISDWRYNYDCLNPHDSLRDVNEKVKG